MCCCVEVMDFSMLRLGKEETEHVLVINLLNMHYPSVVTHCRLSLQECLIMRVRQSTAAMEVNHHQ